MRAYLLEKFYEWSTIPYQRWFKSDTEAWDLSKEELLSYPEGSLGNDLGIFLDQNGFSPQDKLESHDVFHVLTGSGVAVPEEVSMQFYLKGNGKSSAYLYMVMTIGLLFYPDKIKRFIYAYREGKKSDPFHHLNFQDLLTTSTNSIKNKYSICQNVYEKMPMKTVEYALLRMGLMTYKKL